jgi:membrane-associated protease RseP (regulator of RpoE activity)
LDNQQTPERPRGVNPAPIQDAKSGPWTFLVLALAIVAGMYWLSTELGPDAPWKLSKAAIGLGFVIFLHELGHFAVAKWCDVHVEAFSLGFGPAIPGLSFRRGETLYKIAWIPLGGYVKMVGEGSETEEDDDNPRSFKNKTVGQRMAIISAGVVMNVILGCVCFILAYHGGVKQSPAVVGLVEPGSPAWKHGMRSGQVIKHIGDVDNPYFEDLLFVVMLSREGQEFRTVVAWPGPGEQERTFYITPRRDANDSKPVIGIAPPSTTQVATKQYSRRGKFPPAYGPAGAARALVLHPGDVAVATSDPNNSKQMNLLPVLKAAGTERTDYDALCQRFLELAGSPIMVEVRRADGGTAKVELDASGIEYGDVIVGTTDPRQTGAYDPYKTADLDPDPRPGADHPDFFEFNRRMRLLAGKPVVLLIRRHGEKESSAPVAVLVPPAFHQGISGLHMKMGKVKAVRGGSAAENAGVQPGDRIIGVELTHEKQTLRVVRQLSKDKLPDGTEEKPLDSVRLPFDLRQWVGDRVGVQATITVARDNAQQHRDDDPKRLPPVTWESDWRFDRELPLALAAPQSIPELGVAYQIDTLVDKVDPGTPAAAQLREFDEILAVSFKEASRDNGDKWGTELELYQKKNEREPWWANVAAIYEDPDIKAIKLKVRRGTEEQEVELDLTPDPTWPMTERGLRLMPDQRLQKADGPLQAVGIGVTRTYQMIVKTYMSLSSMITGRVSAVKNLRGPISIAQAAFDIAGEGFSQFMFFLAIISVNLAVINFLPIPVLDGGHMVFLIYEKLRGRPATEQVRLAFTYVGLLLILSLMAFVIYLDVKRNWFSG